MHWKTWTILCTLAWSAWGIAVKYAVREIGWQRLEILSAFAALIMMAIIAPAAYQIKPDAKNMLGLFAGSLGAAGGMLFYIAISKGPVSVIIPVTSLYVVGVAIAGMVLFGETLTVRKLVGISLAAAAMIVLAGEK